jgi:hypothetical protein
VCQVERTRDALTQEVAELGKRNTLLQSSFQNTRALKKQVSRPITGGTREREHHIFPLYQVAEAPFPGTRLPVRDGRRTNQTQPAL